METALCQTCPVAGWVTCYLWQAQGLGSRVKGMGRLIWSLGLCLPPLELPCRAGKCFLGSDQIGQVSATQELPAWTTILAGGWESGPSWQPFGLRDP